MKTPKLLVLAILMAFFVMSKAQNTTLEKNILGIQLGIDPVMVYYETHLYKNITLNTHIGMGFALESDDDVQWGLIPRIGIQPKLYYNLQRRLSRNKSIDNNCGNYFSLLTTYSFGNKAFDDTAYPQFSITPMWGFRTPLGEKFVFEINLGIGIAWIYKDYSPEEYFGYNSPYTYYDYNLDKIKETETVIGPNIMFGFSYVF